MTFLAMVMSLFPAGVMFVVALVTLAGLSFGHPLLLCIGVFLLYALPLAAFHVHEHYFPVREGPSYLDDKSYSAWWGGHQTQILFIAFPALERALRLVPGLFALWLRAWGSDVGKRVYFTPGLEIGDRSFLSIGDDVVFGHAVQMSSHLVKRTRAGRLFLYVRAIHVGDRAFVGAGCVIGPGVFVEDDATLAAGSYVYPNTRTARGSASTATTKTRRTFENE